MNNSTRLHQPIRPTPPARRSSWGVSDRIARQYGYPASRPPTTEDRLAYLEELTEWLADRLEAATAAERAA